MAEKTVRAAVVDPIQMGSMRSAMTALSMEDEQAARQEVLSPEEIERRKTLAAEYEAEQAKTAPKK